MSYQSNSDYKKASLILKQLHYSIPEVLILHQQYLGNLNKILYLKRFCIRYKVELNQTKRVFMIHRGKRITVPDRDSQYFCDTCIQNYNDTHICKKEVLVWLSILEKKKDNIKKNY